MSEPQVPEPDYEDPKEVYAFYGLAMYTSQLLEHSMLNLGSGPFMTKAPAISHQVFDAAFSDMDTKTSGKLLKAVRRLMSVPPQTDCLLVEALRKRNYLTRTLQQRKASYHGDDFE